MGLGMGLGLVHLMVASRSGLASFWESSKQWQGAGEATEHPKGKQGRAGSGVWVQWGLRQESRAPTATPCCTEGAGTPAPIASGDF